MVIMVLIVEAIRISVLVCIFFLFFFNREESLWFGLSDFEVLFSYS